MDKILFLDIDGVLNCENAYKRGDCKYIDRIDSKRGKTHHQSFDPIAKEFLNKLIKETEAKIVISSTWRSSGLRWMKEVWEFEKMSGEIIGITPDFRGFVEHYTIPRGCEIDSWLKDKEFSHINWSVEEQQKWMDKSGIENYIIIDDDSDMLYGQRHHFVHVLPSPRNKDGFCERYYKDALNKLSKTVIELNF